MFTLLFVLTAPYNYLGTFQDLQSCRFAIREIYATRMNAAGQRHPEVEKAIDEWLKLQREFICVPVKK